MSHKIAAIFDLDDTLFHTQWRSHLLEPAPGTTRKNWPAFFEACKDDPINAEIAQIARDFAAAGAEIIVCSGRTEDYQDISLSRLAEEQIVPSATFFRKKEFFAKDHVLKNQWVERLKKQGYTFVASFDDRDHNVEVFRAHGIPTANALNMEEVRSIAKEGLSLLECKLAAIKAHSVIADTENHSPSVVKNSP